MMNVKGKQFDTTLLAGSRRKMQQHCRIETTTKSDCDAECGTGCDAVRNNNARQNVFQRALKYRIQQERRVIQWKRFP